MSTSSRSNISEDEQQLARNPSSLPPPHDTHFSRLHDVAFIFTVCMAQFMSLAGLAQSVAPLFIIGRTYGVFDPGELSWYAAAYSLTVGTFILPAGRLGDMYGHKKMFLFGWFWFGLWALIAGVSVWSGSILFNVSRGFQGIGPAILVPNAMALIGKTYPMGLKKNIIFSCFGAGGPTGFVVGAVMSALLGQLIWWPWAYWALTIASVFFLGLAFVVIPADTKQPPSVSGSSKPRFDYLGAVTGVSGLILINFAWNQGPVVGWQTPYVYALLIVGFLLMIAFFIAETYLTQHPLIPIRGLKKEAGFALTCIGAGWGSHGIWFYYIYLFLQNLRHSSPLLTTAQCSPVAITGPIFALFAGWLMTKTRPANIMLTAMVFFTVGFVLVTTAPVNQSYWIQIFLSLLIMPGGMNLSFPAGTILMSNALPKENQGIAASLVSTTVNYSISIGLGFAGTIDKYITPDASAPGGQNLLRGYRGAWWFGFGLCGFGLLVALSAVLTSSPSNPMNSVKTTIQQDIGLRKQKRDSKQFPLPSNPGSTIAVMGEKPTSSPSQEV